MQGRVQAKQATVRRSTQKAVRLWGQVKAWRGSQPGEWYVRGSKPGMVYRVEMVEGVPVCLCQGYSGDPERDIPGHGCCYHATTVAMLEGLIPAPTLSSAPVA